MNTAPTRSTHFGPLSAGGGRRRRLSWDGAFWKLLAGLSAVFIYLSANIQVFLSGDPVTQYAPTVMALLSGQGIKAFAIDPYRGPLFPALVAAVAWLLRGDVFVAGQVVEVAAYTLLIVAVFVVVRTNWDARLACLTATGVGACTPVLINGLAWLSDIPFTVLTLLSLWCMYAAKRHWGWAPLAAGLLAGLAFDTRWNGAFLLGVAVVAVVLNPWRAPPARLALWLLLFGAGFLLAAGPWLAINNANHGSPFFNRLNEVPLEQTLVSPRLGPAPSLTDLILGDPVFFWPRYLRRLAWDGLLQVSAVVPLVLAIFIPAGAVTVLRGLDRGKLLLAGFVGVYWAIAALTHFEARYYFPMLPLLAALPWLFLLSDAVPDVRLHGSASLKLCVLGAVLVWAGAGQIQAARAWSASVNANFQPQTETAKMLAAPPPGAVKGTRVAMERFSGARYFIPRASGLRVGVLKTPDEFLDPPSDYSHVLVEEGVPEFKVPPSLLDPLLAKAQFEAMYYKSEKPRAVLYQVISDNQLLPVQAITVSAALDSAHGPAAVLDANSQSGWLAPLAAAPNETATLTADLGQAAPVNRVWLLPSADPVLWPEDYRIETSPDGLAWTQAALVEHDPLN